MKKIITILMTVAVLSSCYKVDFSETDHPDKATINVDITSQLDAEGLSSTDSMTFILNGQVYSFDPNDTFSIPELLDPGTYTYYVYNSAQEDNSATIDYDSTAGTLIATVASTDGYLDPNPNTLYVGIGTLELVADMEATVNNTEITTLGKELSFKLEIDEEGADKMDSVLVSLSGVAQQWDCLNNVPYGTSASVIPNLTITSSTESSSASKADEQEKFYIEGSITILGIVPDQKQELEINIDYTDGNPASYSNTQDISDLLDNFNDDDSQPITLSNTIETPTESNSGGSISDWTTNYQNVEAK